MDDPAEGGGRHPGNPHLADGICPEEYTSRSLASHPTQLFEEGHTST